MSDDPTIPTTEPTEDATADTPELTDEAVAAYLSSKTGQAVTPADIDRFKNLDAMARQLQVEKSALGRAKKAEAAAPTTTDDDTEPDLSTIDPATRKLLRKFMETEFGAELSLPTTLMEDDVDEAIASFLDAHTDIAPEKLGEVIAELEASGAGPKRPTKRATTAFLKVAYDIAKARDLDPEAIEKAAYQKALETIAKESKEKGNIVAVEKKQGVSEKVDPDVENASLGFWERLGIAG